MNKHAQQGAALVVCLILMMVMTILGVSGMKASMLELTMAGNSQYGQDAFEAAETGIDMMIAGRGYSTVLGSPGNAIPATPLGDGTYSTESTATFQTTTPVPDGGYSGGVGVQGTIQAFHFDVVSTGTGPRAARATHNQSFYEIGPGGS